MTTTTFVNATTLTDADWFNDLDRLHYDIFSDPADIAAVKAALHAAPGAIGGTTPAAGAFTTLGATGLTTVNGQIKFPATQNASADDNTLDDYEQGTWTPVITDGTNNATMTGSGTYTKIGRHVTLSADVSTSSLGSVTGDIKISGMPFASTQYCGVTAGWGTGLAITAGQSVGVFVFGTFLILQVWDATTGTTVMQASEWSADGRIIFSVSYDATA